MKKIYLVFEQGAGIIHQAFETRYDAYDFVDKLKEKTGFDCYEVLEVFLEFRKS